MVPCRKTPDGEVVRICSVLLAVLERAFVIALPRSPLSEPRRLDNLDRHVQGVRSFVRPYFMSRLSRKLENKSLQNRPELPRCHRHTLHGLSRPCKISLMRVKEFGFSQKDDQLDM